MNPTTFSILPSFTEQLHAYTLQGASFSKENFYYSIYSVTTHLAFHAQLVHIRFADSLNGTTRLLDLIPRNDQEEGHEQFVLNLAENHIVLLAARQVTLVHGNQHGAGVKDEGGVHKNVVQVSLLHQSTPVLLRNLLHVIVGAIHHEHDARRLGEVLIQLSTGLQQWSKANPRREG